MAENCDGSAVVSYGAKLQVKATASATEYIDVGGVTDFNGPQTSRSEIDVTTLCSTAKEYVLDLKDHGTFTSTLQTRLGDPAQQMLIAGLDATSPYYFRLVLTDDGYSNGPVNIDFPALVQSFPISGGMGQVVTTSLSLRITGEVLITYPTDTP